MFEYNFKYDFYLSPIPSKCVIHDAVYETIKEKPSTSITVWLRRLIMVPEYPSKFFIKL
jgi:hypothetical protein